VKNASATINIVREICETVGHYQLDMQLGDLKKNLLMKSCAADFATEVDKVSEDLIVSPLSSLP